MKNFLTFFKPVFITSIYNKYYPIWLKKGKNTQTIKPQLHCYSNWGIQVMSEERLNRRQCWPAFSFINHVSGIVLEHLQEFSNFTALSLRSNHFTHVAIHVLMLSLHCQPSPHSRCVLVKSKKGHCGILCDTAWSWSTSTLEKLRIIFIISNLCIIIFPYGPYSRSTTNIKERNMKSMQREGRIRKSNCWGYSICSFCKKNRNYLWEGFHKNPSNTSIVTHHFTQANKAFPGSLEDGGTCSP